MLTVAGLARRDCLLLFLVGLPLGCQQSGSADWESPAPVEWRTHGGSLARNFSRGDDAILTRENVDRLVPLWRFTTGAVVTASPIVASVDLPNGSRIKFVYISSWDGNFYPQRANSNSPTPNAVVPSGRNTLYVSSVFNGVMRLR